MFVRKMPIVSTLVVAILVACAPAAPAPASAPGPAQIATPTAAVPQKITHGVQDLYSSLDPHAAIGAGSFPIWEGMTSIQGGSVVPALAASWKVVNDTTWQFSLAPNRTFHDGSPVTVADIKWNYDRVMDPANKLAVVARIPTIKAVEIVDSKTVNVTTKNPDPILLKRVAVMYILSKALFDKIGADRLAVQAVGTGPFKVKEYVQSDHITFAAFREHPNPPILEELTYRLIPEASARLNGLRTGYLDVAEGIDVPQTGQLKSAGFQIIVYAQGRSNGAWMDATLPGSPTQDKRVRQALNYAVNKDLIANEILSGFTRPEQGQVIQSTVFGFNPNLKPYPYDPKKAKELLAAAGYPNGFTIRADILTAVVQAQQVWQLIKQEFKDVGVELEINFSGDNAAYLDRYYARVQRPHLMNVRINTLPVLDADFVMTWYDGAKPTPQRLFNNPEFDRLYHASLTEMNEAKRRELLQQAVAVMNEDPPHLFLTEGFDLYGVSPAVEGLTAEATLIWGKARRVK